MVLATQCLLQRRPKTLRVDVAGRMPPGVCAKDLILAHHRENRRGRRHGPRHRVRRRGGSRALDGTADDGLQHVDRGGRPRGTGRAGRDDDRLPGRAARRAGRRRVGRRGRHVARPRHRRGRPVRSAGVVRLRRAGADDHVRHEPRDGRGRRRARSRSRFARRPAARGRRSGGAGVHAGRAGQAAARHARSTSSSSAAAPTGGCPTCATRPRSSAAGAWRRASGRSSCPDRSR